MHVMQYDFTKIQEARLKRRMTKTELAKRTGLSVATIHYVETGRGPWLKAIREIEHVLGIKNVIKTKQSA
jgi:transcriptional regulator with XRE-family HTH domain